MRNGSKESPYFEAMPEAWFARLVQAKEKGFEAGVQAASKELARLGFHVCLISQAKDAGQPQTMTEASRS